MKKEKRLISIPFSRILALILMDIMSIIVAAFAALYIRFEFSFSNIDRGYLDKLGYIILPNIFLTLLFYYGYAILKLR